MPSRQWVLGWQVTLGYIVAAIAIAATAWAAAHQLREARMASDRAGTTLAILRQVGDVEIALLAAESNQRGYLMTGEEAYLPAYERAVGTVAPALASLELLVAANPTQRERVELVRGLADAKLAELRQTLDLWRAANPAAARQVVNSVVGKGIMSRITGLLDEVEQEEQALLQRQMSERRASFWWAGRVALASSAAALLVVALATFAANAEVRRRAHAERTLRANEEWLRVTLRSIADAVIATNSAGRVVFLNEAARALTGWPEADARGRALGDVFHAVDDTTGTSPESPVMKVLQAGAPLDLVRHRRLISRDGRELPIDSSGAPIRDERGEIMGVVLIFRDISERKRQHEQQEQLRREGAARAAAERDSRTKDEFLAILSHELRSPLQGILGWVQVLSETQADARRRSRALQAIERGLRQQAQLVNDVLDVSRIVAGKLQLESELVEIGAVVEECVDQALPEAREKQIVIECDLEHCGFVRGDRHRLQQAVTNFLSNAIKFTPAGGRIDVSCARDASDVVISVADTGQGIAADFLPHVFDRFMQADTGARPAAAGLGLGLSIVRQIAEVHGGSVRAASEGVGRGSRFTLRLPSAADLNQPGAAGEATPGAPGSSLDGVSILVVDDDAETRESLAVLLGSRGATVRQAGSAAAGLDQCRRKRPDVIISDISMPEQDGYEFIDTLRAGDGGAQPIALALTGFAANSDRERAAAAGFDGHVAKPVDLDQLVNTIMELLDADARRSARRA